MTPRSTYVKPENRINRDITCCHKEEKIKVSKKPTIEQAWGSK